MVTAAKFFFSPPRARRRGYHAHGFVDIRTTVNRTSGILPIDQDEKSHDCGWGLTQNASIRAPFPGRRGVFKFELRIAGSNGYE